jgi:hypothetical protein
MKTIFTSLITSLFFSGSLLVNLDKLTAHQAQSVSAISIAAFVLLFTYFYADLTTTKNN